MEPQIDIEQLQKNFKTMSYGANVEDVSQAEKWLNNVAIVDRTTEITQCLKKLQSLSTWTKPTVELFISFAEALEKNVNLICQIEILSRGVLAKDTRKAVELLTQYLYSIKEPLSSVDISRPYVGVFKNQPLWILGDFIKLSLFGYKGTMIVTDLSFAPVLTLIAELAINVGLSNMIVIPTSRFDISTHLPSKEMADLFLYDGECEFYEAIMTKYRAFSFFSETKTCSLVFENADLDSAVEAAIEAAWGYQGMQPWSIDTILIQESVFEKFTEKMKNRIKSLIIGNGDDKLADLSYPRDPEIRRSCLETVKKAKRMGIDVFQKDSDEALSPTLLIGCKAYTNNVVSSPIKDNTVTLLPFRSIDEGVNLANNSKHGFAISVWTENVGLANEVAQKLQMTNVWINGHGLFTAAIPFTSWKSNITLDISDPRLMKSGKHVQAVHDAIAAAKTASDGFSRKSLIEKHKIFLKLRPFLKEVGQQDLQEWVENQAGLSTFNQEGYYVTPQKCPRGVVVLYLENDDIRTCLEPVLISIFGGNGTLVFTNNQSTTSVLQTIAKVFPSGLLTVLPSSADAIDTADENENVHLRSTMKHLSDKKHVLFWTTKYKYIWTNIGQSSQCNL